MFKVIKIVSTEAFSYHFNDIAIACKVDEIKWSFIEKNTFDGIEGIVRLSEIKKYRNQTYLN